MYHISFELSQKISNLIAKSGIDNPDLYMNLFNDFVKLYVRENRRLRQQILELGREFAEAADDKEMDDEGTVAGYAAEETCIHIADKIIRDHIRLKKTNEISDVDRLIQEFYEEDDE